MDVWIDSMPMVMGITFLYDLKRDNYDGIFAGRGV